MEGERSKVAKGRLPRSDYKIEPKLDEGIVRKQKSQ